MLIDLHQAPTPPSAFVTICQCQFYSQKENLEENLFKKIFYLYIYPPDSQESDGGAIHRGKQLPRPASGDAKILLSASNLVEI